MTHIMKRGAVCAYSDGHKGKCQSAESRDKHREYWHEWKKDNPDYQSPCTIRNPMYFNDPQRQAVALYGSHCACCGSTEDLQIDHILGAGSEHVRSLGSAKKFYMWLIKNRPMGFQALCIRCNSSKKDTSSCRLHHTWLESFPILPEKRNNAARYV